MSKTLILLFLLTFNVGNAQHRIDNLRNSIGVVRIDYDFEGFEESSVFSFKIFNQPHGKFYNYTIGVSNKENKYINPFHLSEEKFQLVFKCISMDNQYFKVLYPMFFVKY